MATLTGPVRAKETGSRPIEMSQSRLETRPSISPGTWRCLAVAHTIVPAVPEGVEGQGRDHELPDRAGHAVASHGERGEGPGDVHEGDVTEGKATTAQDHAAVRARRAARREPAPAT
jgi:hypothetical protein